MGTFPKYCDVGFLAELWKFFFACGMKEMVVSLSFFLVPVIIPIVVNWGRHVLNLQARAEMSHMGECLSCFPLKSFEKWTFRSFC